jgi:hypothetical protein
VGWACGEPERDREGFARRLLCALRRRQNHRQASLCDTALGEGGVWQRRFYGFVVWSKGKRVAEVAISMRRNPVKRGLVPEQVTNYVS